MYNPNFDFKYLKTKLSIDQVLAAYGLDAKLKRQNHLLYGPCPLHGGDNPTAFHVHLKRGLWRCFTACGGRDIVDLIRSIEKCSFAKAAHHLNRLMGHVKPSSDSLFYTSLPPNNCTFSPFVYHIPLKPSVPFLLGKGHQLRSLGDLLLQTTPPLDRPLSLRQAAHDTLRPGLVLPQVGAGRLLL